VSKGFVPVRQDPRKMRYIEWLTTPPTHRQPKTEVELAREIDVFPKTLYNWRQERDFREVWSDDTDRVVGGEDRRQRVMDTLYDAAVDHRNPRHVAAAKLYLDTLGAISPPREGVSGKAIGMLTDDEIEQLLSRGILEQHDRRDEIDASS
jgi:hypothetical protein